VGGDGGGGFDSAVLNVPSRHFNRTIDGIQELKSKGYEVSATRLHGM